MPKRVTLELDVDEAKGLLEGWEKSLVEMQSERTNLDGKITALKNRIASVRAKLTGQELLPQSNKPRQPGTGTQTERTPKGHNLKVVKSFLKSVAPSGKTATEIARETNIGVSSVYAVLTRHEKLFKKTEDGLWSMK